MSFVVFLFLFRVSQAEKREGGSRLTLFETENFSFQRPPEIKKLSNAGGKPVSAPPEVIDPYSLLDPYPREGPYVGFRGSEE